MGVGKIEPVSKLLGYASARRLREAVESIIRDSSYREQAQAWQQYIQQWPGPEAAVDIISSLAASEEPPAPFFQKMYAEI
jgi:UDP:flavonoid glycosyltransferase YjiC (YdhE family)